MALTEKEHQTGDRIARMVTPEELEFLRSLMATRVTFDELAILNRRLIRWARQDPASRRAVEENLYSLVGEIEQLIGP